MADVYIQEFKRTTVPAFRVQVRQIRDPQPIMGGDGFAVCSYNCSHYPSINEAIAAAEKAGCTYEVLEPNTEAL